MSGVVVAVDGTAGTADAVALGATLSTALGVGATLVCVHPPRALSARVGGRAFEDRDADADAARRILDAVAWPAPDGAPARRAVAASTPALGLRMAAAEAGADVVVVGSSHRHGLGRALPGTTAMRLVAERAWPVAIAAPPRAALQHIAIAYDGTGAAHGALRFAAHLTARARAELTVLDVAVPQTPLELARYGPGAAPHIGARAARESARHHLAEALAALPPDLPATTRLLEGEDAAAGRLVDASADVDLLVLGSHGRTTLERLLLGSTSDAVAAGARCPLVVVPARAPKDGARPATDDPCRVSASGARFGSEPAVLLQSMAR